jgi:hypothetical protein
MKKFVLIISALLIAATAFGINVLPPRYNAHYSYDKGANCKLLIHSNDADGNTTFLDACPVGRTVSVGAADVEHDTDQSKFLASSILFDGDSGYLYVADHADWAYGAGNFTIDFWVRFNSLPAVSDWKALFSQYVDNDNRIQGFVFNNAGTYQIIFLSKATAGPVEVNVTMDTTLVVNKWYHFAIIRGWGGQANDFMITQNGAALETAVTDADAVPDLAATLDIGKLESTVSGVKYLDGWIDEFRVVKGTAMWTQWYWPPSRYYLN